MKYKNRKKALCLYFNNTSLILLDFIEMKYTSSILQSLKKDTSIWKVYLNYTSEFDIKHINLERLLQVYF